MKKILEQGPVLLLLLGALLILGAIYIWAPVCTDLHELKNGNMVHMSCHYAAVAESLFALIMAGLAIDSFIIKRKNIITPILLGILIFLLIRNSDLSIGICMMDTMDCHKTAPWLHSGAVLSVFSGITAFFQKRKGKPGLRQLD